MWLKNVWTKYSEIGYFDNLLKTIAVIYFQWNFFSQQIFVSFQMKFDVIEV